VIVGKSMPTDDAAKCFGFVTDYDTKPKRRLAELRATFERWYPAMERTNVPQPKAA